MYGSGNFALCCVDDGNNVQKKNRLGVRFFFYFLDNDTKYEGPA